MRKEKISTCYYVFKLKDFNSKKSKILELVTKNLKTQVARSGENILNNKNDYFENNNYTNKIANYFSEPLEEFTDLINKEIYGHDSNKEISDKFLIRIINLWSQEYSYGQEHPWHTHTNSDYSAVFYLELPNNNTTEILGYDKKIFKVNAEEGDLVIFPSQTIHRSKKNTNKEKKIIISFNMKLI